MGKVDSKNSSLKIAMIGHKYVPSREGGIEVVVENLSESLTTQGHKITLFNRKRKEYPVIDEYNGCKVENIFTVNRRSLDAIVYSYFATRKAKKLAKKGQFDVLHFHAEGPCFFLNHIPKKKKRKYKVVVTIHGLDWQRGKWGGLASRVLKSGEKKAVKYADEIIVLSKNVQDYFLDKYGRQTIYIPNGVQPPVFHEPEIIKDKYGLDKNSYILFLARIVPEKGLHYLIDAWKKAIKQIDTNLKLVIAGGPSHSDEYYTQIQDKIKGDDTILSTGFVEGQTLNELYSNAFMYVLPSDLEGMPMSLLEAMSYGNICLVSDIPENTEVINDNCYVFGKGDVDDLSRRLIELINSDLTAHKKPVVQYSWKEVAERTADVYLR